MARNRSWHYSKAGCDGTGMCCKKKKCLGYEVAGSIPRVRPQKTVQKDCQAHKLNKEDAVDHSRWRKLIKDNW